MRQNNDIRMKLENDTYIFPISAIPFIEKTLEDVEKKRQRLIEKKRIPENFPQLSIKIDEISPELCKIFQKKIEKEINEKASVNFERRLNYHCLVKLNHGVAPVLNSWKILGMIEKNPETSSYTLSSFNEAEPVPHAYRDADPCNCDHCGKNRKRNSTFIIKNMKTEELQQVGKSCMKDFVDEKELEMLMFHAAFKDIADDWVTADFSTRESMIEIYPKKEYLAAISAYMRHENGYRSFKKSDFWNGAPHTSMVAKHHIDQSGLFMFTEHKRFQANSHLNTEEEKRSLRKKISDYENMVLNLPVTDEDYKRAEKTIEYFEKNPPTKDDNEFYFNMHSVITNDSVFLYKGESGRVSYAIEYFDQGIKKKLKEKFEKNKIKNSVNVPDYLGVEKMKIEEIELKLTGFKEVYDDMYGYSNVYYMETHDGRQVCWKASQGTNSNGRPDCFYDYTSEDAIRLKIKDAVDSGKPLWIKLKGSISKYYETSKGIKRTYISRCSGGEELYTEPQTNGVPILNEKYITGEFKITSIEKGISKGSGQQQYRYNLEDRVGGESFLIINEELKDLKSGDFFKCVSHEKAKELLSIQPEKVIKLDSFSEDFCPEILTKAKAMKFGVEKPQKTKSKKIKV